MTRTETDTKTWTAEELFQRILKREPFYVIDVRNRKEFARWKIPVPFAQSILNIPYFEILERGGREDVLDSALAFAEAHLKNSLPADKPILCICAKGDTSEYIAEALRRLSFRAYNLTGGMREWANLYILRPITQEPSLSLYQIQRPSRGCLSYVAVSEGEAVVVDPLRHTEKYTSWAKANGWDITLILDTHAHADHISGGAKLSAETGAPYYLHPYDGIHPLDVLPARCDFRYLRDRAVFRVGTTSIQAIHIPGHTLGNTAFWVNEKYLLTGDSLFIQSISRPDLGGQAKTWAHLHYASLQRLLALPDETIILPGHYTDLSEVNSEGYVATSIGNLRAQNPSVKALSSGEEEFVEYVLRSLPEFPPEYIDIKRVNLGLKEASEQTAEELETGENICALSGVKP